MRLIDADALRKNAQHAKDISKWDGELLVVGLGHVLNAPTIESPRPDWTPCAEGLPKKVDYRLWSKNVLATVEQKTGERYVIEAYYHYGHEKWKHDQYEDFYVGEVIAWMNIPEPYNPDRKEDAK